ncbi:MAG: AMP-binding protein [Nocardioides sp.]|nr:AMP-binding protein [Nocardioides sp.]
MSAGTVAAPTFGSLVAARSEDDSTALFFEDERWTWREVVAEAWRRVALVRSLDLPAPGHVALACANTPEHLFWWFAAGLGGFTVVGVNPTRRGPDLARDLRHTDCRLVVHDATRADALDGVDHGVPPDRVLDVEAPAYGDLLASCSPASTDAALPEPGRTLSLVFTSGTTAAPKAVICSQSRMGRIALQQQERRSLTADDVFYVVMPMFHSNAVMAGVAPAVAAGGAIALRRSFSASGFLPDVRRYGATFFNYVGKPLSYVLATPEQPDDADNSLRIAFGNEANEADIAAFGRRFGCQVVDSFGSSEGEIRIMRTPETPPGSLGVAPEGTVVLDPETLDECPRGVFDTEGRLLNPDEAIGEIVNREGAALFEGYYANPDAEAARLRHGWAWSGDLAYRDEAGFWYFAGRTGDWLRVDGENLAAAPIERLLARFPGVVAIAVVAAPDPAVGDQVRAVVEMRPGTTFDPEAFGPFLAAQPDLGTLWAPREVWVVDALPRTPTNKVVKRAIPDVPEGATVFRRVDRELLYTR